MVSRSMLGARVGIPARLMPVTYDHLVIIRLNDANENTSNSCGVAAAMRHIGWVSRFRGPRCDRGEVLFFLYLKSL